jgi:hypothetical protein
MITRAPRRVAPLVVLFALVAGSACGSAGTSASKSSPVISGASSTSTGTPGRLDPAVSMPSGFPSDFPVYPGARLTAANQVTANGQTTWGMQWETQDSVQQVQSFYASKLNGGDWTISYNGSTNGSFSAIFMRRSNSKNAGILGVEPQSGVTHITLAFGMAT